MNGAKHTPGPWRTDVDEDAHCKVIKDSDGRLVAELFRHGFDDDFEHEANARLIAAAPRLAEALQRLLNSRHPYAPELHHTEAFRKYVVAESFAREALREAGVEQ